MDEICASFWQSVVVSERWTRLHQRLRKELRDNPGPDPEDALEVAGLGDETCVDLVNITYYQYLYAVETALTTP